PADASANPPPTGGFSIGTGSVHVADQANVTVSGVASWSGSVQFSLCGPPAADCTSGGTPIGSAVPIDNTTAQPISSPTAKVTSVGTYCWRGDLKPNPAPHAGRGPRGTHGAARPGLPGEPAEPAPAA